MVWHSPIVMSVAIACIPVMHFRRLAHENWNQFCKNEILRKGKVMDNSIIYTDGHGVKITDSTFYVHRQSYSLDGIKEIKLLKIPSRKAPGIILFVIGFILMLLGSLGSMEQVSFETARRIVVLDADMVAIVAGVLLVVTAIVVSILTKSKYAVKITTAEGEKRPLESRNREYVAHVVNSLKRAYYKYVRSRQRRNVV